MQAKNNIYLQTYYLSSHKNYYWLQGTKTIYSHVNKHINTFVSYFIFSL